MKLTLRHHEAVWETTTIDVDVPSVAYPVEHANDLIEDAICSRKADITCGDSVDSVEPDPEILDEMGNHLYRSRDENDESEADDDAEAGSAS